MPPTTRRAGAKLDDWRRTVYENSLLLAMGAIFVATWLGQSLNNWREFNATQREHGAAAISWGRYLLDPDFWSRTLQNWQSEFLAVGTMAVFTIYLRQRGSPESKPVGAPHDETGFVRIGRVPGTVPRTRPGSPRGRLFGPRRPHARPPAPPARRPPAR